MKKELSIFIDESGDFGFEKIGASRFYILTLVFHDQTKSIAGQLAKIAKEPVFHAGPLIRQEYPFEKESIEERKKIFQSIFMFTLSLPIQCQSFCYEKKEFDGSLLGLQGKMARDLHFFLEKNLDEFSQYDEAVIYYDNGQNEITKILNSSFAISGIRYSFKKKVSSEKYRLFQVADFILTIRLMEMKLNDKSLSNSEKKFIDLRRLKKNYIKAINRKSL
jgi:hypothetical protein